ncbi:hypothetical protein NDU88_004055 [Pleurodeles waltl]|uniref:Uncharacterized protein n=1 Tax=Pleurodeles waltl TaxID=8319 RepID=A0AAV7M6T1_PLEWA|nr:hypothetical protein NDU88_004055 [Pleurodeles waltl]
MNSEVPYSLCLVFGRRFRLSGGRAHWLASLLLCFFGARTSGLRYTPSALPRSSEYLLAPAPSLAKSLRSRSLLFLERSRSSLHWPRAHTRVLGCAGLTKWTALQFPILHRSLGTPSVQLAPPGQLCHPLDRSTLGLSCSDRVPPPDFSLSVYYIFIFKGPLQGADLIFGGAGTLLRGSVGAPSGLRRSARGITRNTHPTPGCRFRVSAISLLFLSAAPYISYVFGGQIPRSLRPDSGCGCGERGPLAPPDSPPLCFFRARTSGPRSTLSAPPRSSDRCPLARFLAVVFLWGPHLGPPLRALGTPLVQQAPSGPSAVTR